MRLHLTQVEARSMMMIDQTEFLEKSIELAEIPGTALKISRVSGAGDGAFDHKG
jgi:hypothetical protein